MMSKLLTIAMSTYDDFDGVYFTIQSLRLYHEICQSSEVEFVILDNNPHSRHGHAIKNLINNWNKDIKYIPFTNKITSFNKYKTVDYADGEMVIILDSHVLLIKDAIKNLINYLSIEDHNKNLVQGPLFYDDLKTYATEFNAVWSGDMYGVWHTNHEQYLKKEPFEILCQGMGLCAFKKQFFPSINPNFRGFGAEEWYIQEKFRQNGGKVICLPSFGWIHRFDRPNGVQYRLSLEDRIFNYFLGWLELYKDENHPMIKSIIDNFKHRINNNILSKLLIEAKSFQ